MLAIEAEDRILQIIRERPQGYKAEEEFRRLIPIALGVDDHPKAETLVDMAWDMGHGNGYEEIWLLAKRFSKLLR